MKLKIHLHVILLAVCLMLTTSGLCAESLQRHISCPVCNIEYAALVTASPTSELCLDGRPADGRIAPLAECPLCHGVFGDNVFSLSEVALLKKFAWSRDFQSLKASDAAIRYATLLHYLERENCEIGQAWLAAAWANEKLPEVRQSCLEKSLKFFRDGLSSEKPEAERLFEISIKIADILRQLQKFDEAQQWLSQMQQKADFKSSWFPMVIRHCSKLVEAKDSSPSPLPTGNALHAAIAAKNNDEITRLAANRDLLGEINAAGQTPLIQVISSGNEAMVDLLVKAGASLAQTDLNGNTPLHHAASLRMRKILDIILPASGNLDPVNNKGATPLLLAAENSREDAVDSLLQAGADFNHKDSRGNTILHILSLKKGYQRRQVIAKLASQFQDINVRNFDDYTPLHLAALDGNRGALQCLLEAGAKIDARMPDGSTALFFCKPIMTSALISHGADINLQNNAGHTALVAARLNGDKERVTFLKRTGRFGTRPRDFFLKSGATKSIFTAVKSGDLEAIKEIVRRDPGQLNFKEREISETPLHMAAAAGNPETVKLLLDLECDVNATNEFMRTPMHYAATQGNLDVVKLLHEAGANIQAVDVRGSTPLHDAAAARHRKVYIYLLELDASDTTRNNEGRTAAELFADQ